MSSLCEYVRETFYAVAATLKGEAPPAFLRPPARRDGWTGARGRWPGVERSIDDVRGRARAARDRDPPGRHRRGARPAPARGTDLLIVEAVARRAAQILGDAYLLPTIPFGTSIARARAAGTADFTPDVLRRVVQNVAVGLHETGIHRVAIVAGPGLITGNTVVPFGNFIPKAAVRQLNHEYPGMDAIWVQPLAAAARALGEVFESGADDMHAGEVETSLVMALSPNAVGDGAVDHVPPAARHDRDGPVRTLAPGGVWGRPSLASKDKGEAALAAASEATAAYIGNTLATLGDMKKSGR